MPNALPRIHAYSLVRSFVRLFIRLFVVRPTLSSCVSYGDQYSTTVVVPS